MQRYILLLGLCAISLTGFVVPVDQSAAADAPCKSLIVVYCTTCHNTERICNALNKKDKQAWLYTLKKMGKYGDIDESTQKQALQCLQDKNAASAMGCSK